MPGGVAAIDTIHVIRGSNHSAILDNTEEHNRVVSDFFTRHGRGG